MARLLKNYTRFLHKFPILTQAIQTSILMGSGDVIAQTALEKKNRRNYSFIRTAQFTALGFVFVGPTVTTWYRFLARQLGSGGTRVTLKKVALDQLVFAPTFTAVFLTNLGLIQQHATADIKNNIKRNYIDIIISNYKLWPAVQLVNFYITPIQFQPLIVSIVALFWNTYLSWKTQAVHILKEH